MTAPLDVAQVVADLDRLGPLASFPWHRQQQHALAQMADTQVILGGTQGGKSRSMAGIFSRLVRREGPIYRRLRGAETRPLKLWIAPKTGEKAESVWEPLLREFVFAGMPFASVSHPHRVFTWADSVSRENTLWIKCLPKWEVVTMADGTQRPIGAIRVGDRVLGFDYATRRAIPSLVTAVHASGPRKVVRATFADGTTLHATREHRVGVQRHVSQSRRWEVRPLGEVMGLAGHPSCLTARERLYEMPPRLPLDPYLLGVLLGDGSLHPKSGIRLTSADAAVVERSDALLRPLGYVWRKLTSPYGYLAKEIVRRPGRRPKGPLPQALEDLGLLGTTTRSKFIPEVYFHATHAERLALLAGLVDTDGTERRFASVNPGLAQGFARLMRSVGGTATVTTYQARCTNSHTPHRRIAAWRVDYNLNGEALPLALARKQKPASFRSRDTTRRLIVAVEDIGIHDCVDLTIDHPSHLFLAGTAEVAVHNSQDQGLLAFESDAVDTVGFDEEPLDQRLFGAARGRTTTTNGVILLAFTPLHGLTWTHSAFYVPTVRDEYRKADRVWRKGKAVSVVQMGMADNPAAVAGGGVDRLKNDPSLTEAEKRTRLYGEYGYAEGLIFPVLAGLFTDQPDSHYLVDALPVGRPYTWIQTMDPNKRHGGLLVALDHEGNRYAVHEHYAEGLPDTHHARSYREGWAKYGLREDQVFCYADPGGAGAQAILNLADTGILADAVPKGPGSVKASIEMMRRALWIDPQRVHPVTGKSGSPSLFFLRTLRSSWTEGGVEYHESRLLWELRQYRQKDGAPPDTPVKERDDTVDPALYSFLVRPFVPGASETAWGVAVTPPITSTDALSQRAAKSYDQLTQRLVREQRKAR